MNPSSHDDLRRRLRLLQEHNDQLQYQNDLLHEAVETICGAFLNNSRDLDTAIQTAMTLQQRARKGPNQIQRRDRNWDLEIE